MIIQHRLVASVVSAFLCLCSSFAGAQTSVGPATEAAPSANPTNEQRQAPQNAATTRANAETDGNGDTSTPEVPPLPNGGVVLIDAADLAVDKLAVNTSGGSLGTSSVVSVDHPEFKKALRLLIIKQPLNTWDSSISQRTTTKVAKGDALLVGFWARGNPTDAPGGGVAEFVFEKASPPHTKSVQYLIETPTDGKWQHYWIRTESLEDYAAGEATVSFQTGYVRQSFEVAGIEAWNFGQSIPLETLPHTPLSYVGRDAKAKWRTDALDRIEKIRRSSVTFDLIDADGQPLANQDFSVELLSHAFGFGSCVSVDMLLGEGDDADRYREIVKREFNVAVIENGLKWRVWGDDAARHIETLKAIDWLNEQQIAVRGHVMIWPGPRYLPDWIEGLMSQKQALAQVLDMRIREMAYATKGKVRDWDVLNEVFDNPELTNALGDEAMTHWFRIAKSILPDVDLYYNDYAALVRGGHPTTHKDHFEKTIAYLVDHDAPIDGIGLQGHFGSVLTPPSRMLKELDRWSKFDLKILVTEFDVTVPDEALRADFARDFLIAMYSHPSVDGVVNWGFWTGGMWNPPAALYGRDWQPTKLGREWLRLKNDVWMSKGILKTKADGSATFNGYHGVYRATILGRDYTFEISPDRPRVTLSLLKS